MESLIQRASVAGPAANRERAFCVTIGCMTERTPSRVTAAAAVVLAVAVPLLVAAAARSGQTSMGAPPGWQPLRATGSWLATAGTLTLLPVVLIVGVPLFFVVQVLGRRRRDELERAGLLRRPSRIARAIAVAVIVAAIWLIHRGTLHLPTGALDHIGALIGNHGGGGGLPAGRRGHSTGATISTGQWGLAIACWLLMVTAAVLIWRRRGSRGAPTTPPPEPAAATAEEFQTFADVRAERDPTRAVIGAYALMEAMLAGRGTGRRPWEAPVEYLRRVRSELPPAGGPAATLTGLYQRARFGGRGVDPGARGEALAALEHLSDTVEAPR